jgi:3D (Asp-Asp-Asp) domain-containing protein
MKSLVRGGLAFVLTGMLVFFMYARTVDSATLAIANDSQVSIDNNILDSSFILQQDDKKLVKTTASVRKAGAGASRGSFNATAYCLGGKTAMGHGVRRGIIAADPRVLRLGSKVTISAGPWSGTYLVSDTGGGIRGKRLDIWVPSCGEAKRFGRRSIQVFATE